MIDTKAETKLGFGFLSEIERFALFRKLYTSDDPEDKKQYRELLKSSDPLIQLMLLRYLEDFPEKRACAAIIRLIEEPNEVVSEAAMDSYSRSHYPGKPRLLKSLVFSKSFSAMRFAVRTLSRAGYMDVLPLMLREIPEASANARKVLIHASRYLPHRRTVPILLPFGDSKDESLRFLVVDVLAELQPRTRAVPVDFFLGKLKDESDRIRRTAMEALHRFPTRKIQPMVLQAALDEKGDEDTRSRAIRSMQAFPSESSARKLTVAAAKSRSSLIRLSTEIVLRTFPKRELRSGLLPLLEEKDIDVRRHAAYFLAELLGDDPAIRREVLDMWRRAPEEDAMELILPLQVLGGEDTVSLLRDYAFKEPLLAYSAATALSRMRGEVSGRALVDIVTRSGVHELVRQAIFDRWAKRGIEESVREEILDEMIRSLMDPNTNNRYLAAQALARFPLERTLGPLVDLVVREESREIFEVINDQVAAGLGRDPMPMVRAIAVREARPPLPRMMMQVLLRKTWDAEISESLLDTLAEKPFSFPEIRPSWYTGVALHLFEHGGISLQDLYVRVGGLGLGERFLRSLLHGLRNPKRFFPSLPLHYLELLALTSPPKVRELLYPLMRAEGRSEGGVVLAGALLREKNKRIRKSGGRLLRAFLRGSDA